MAGLRNRNAEGDRKIATKYLRPTFGGMTFADINLAALMRWIDQQRATGAISDATIRRNMNLLSRFFGWAVDRGYATANPVRLIPPGKRPRQSGKADAPWIEDDAPVRRVIAKLPEPINLMFYLGNRSGLRTGEIAGLRMSDLGVPRGGRDPSALLVQWAAQRGQRRHGESEMGPGRGGCRGGAGAVASAQESGGG